MRRRLVAIGESKNPHGGAVREQRRRASSTRRTTHQIKAVQSIELVVPFGVKLVGFVDG